MRPAGGAPRPPRREARREHKKRSYIQKYIPHIGDALRDILELGASERDEVVAMLTDTLERSRKI